MNNYVLFPSDTWSKWAYSHSHWFWAGHAVDALIKCWKRKANCVYSAFYLVQSLVFILTNRNIHSKQNNHDQGNIIEQNKGSDWETDIIPLTNNFKQCTCLVQFHLLDHLCSLQLYDVNITMFWQHSNVMNTINKSAEWGKNTDSVLTSIYGISDIYIVSCYNIKNFSQANGINVLLIWKEAPHL